MKSRLLIIVLVGLTSACTQISPWERGILAKPEMALDPNPMHTLLRSHVYGSREAASGGGSTGGGGCGCY